MNHDNEKSDARMIGGFAGFGRREFAQAREMTALEKLLNDFTRLSDDVSRLAKMLREAERQIVALKAAVLPPETYAHGPEDQVQEFVPDRILVEEHTPRGGVIRLCMTPEGEYQFWYHGKRIWRSGNDL